MLRFLFDGQLQAAFCEEDRVVQLAEADHVEAPGGLEVVEEAHVGEFLVDVELAVSDHQAGAPGQELAAELVQGAHRGDVDVHHGGEVDDDGLHLPRLDRLLRVERRVAADGGGDESAAELPHASPEGGLLVEGRAAELGVVLQEVAHERGAEGVPVREVQRPVEAEEHDALDDLGVVEEPAVAVEPLGAGQPPEHDVRGPRALPEEEHQVRHDRDADAHRH
mmetsp:Transcript_20011/g.53104  ORF Transcript_20011/g.53104 Transcript_20011/m.53104 type:complete len:222 (+) Transcript_20011:337-1002(+)